MNDEISNEISNDPILRGGFWCPMKMAHLIDAQCLRFMDQGPKSFCPMECREKMFKRWAEQKKRRETKGAELNKICSMTNKETAKEEADKARTKLRKPTQYNEDITLKKEKDMEKNTMIALAAPTENKADQPAGIKNGRSKACISCGQIRYIMAFGKCSTCYSSQKRTKTEKTVIKPMPLGASTMEKTAVKPISPVAKSEMPLVASPQEMPAVDFIEIRVALPQTTTAKLAQTAHELGVSQDKLTSFWVQERCAL